MAQARSQDTSALSFRLLERVETRQCTRLSNATGSAQQFGK